MKSVNNEIFIKGKKIGSGTYSNVYLVKNNKKNFAYKEYKREIETDDEGNLFGYNTGVLREISLLQILKNNKRNVINIVDIISDNNNNLGVIMNYYEKDLSKVIDNKELNYNDKVKISYYILDAIEFLHSNNIIHRDVKPENILIDSDNFPILTDLTLGKKINKKLDGDTHTNPVATYIYRAPEVVYKKKYSFPIDLWSIGIVIYELFSSSRIETKNSEETINFVKSKIILFKSEKIKDLLDLMKSLLIINPYKRITAYEALKYDIFRNYSFYKKDTISKNKDIQIVNTNIQNMCEDFETQKIITQKAAQHYYNMTNCSEHVAVQLAFKIFETEILDFSCPEFIEEELRILSELNYNLYI